VETCLQQGTTSSELGLRLKASIEHFLSGGYF
jgi:hypothetical protein